MKTVDAHQVAMSIRTDIANILESGEEGVTVEYERNRSFRDILVVVKNKFPDKPRRPRKVKLGKIKYNDGSKGNVYIVAVGLDVNAAKLIMKNVVLLFSQ